MADNDHDDADDYTSKREPRPSFGGMVHGGEGHTYNDWVSTSSRDSEFLDAYMATRQQG